MPTDVADFTGRMATVTGWGRLKYGGGVPSVLQEVQVSDSLHDSLVTVCRETFISCIFGKTFHFVSVNSSYSELDLSNGGLSGGLCRHLV